MLILFISLFISFFLIGLLAFSGEAVMPAFVGNILISQHDWYSPAQVSDLIALSMITPGDLAMNAATMSGYSTAASSLSTGYGFLGSFIATLGLTLPSFLCTAIIHRFQRFLDEMLITKIVTNWLKPLIPGIALSGAILLMNADTMGSLSGSAWQIGISSFLFISTIVGIGKFHFSPIFMLLLCGFAGWLLF